MSPPTARAKRRAAAKTPSLDGIRVLAVDDDQDALDLIREILEAAGAQVSTANSGMAALDTLGSGLPDVLIADLGMPSMDGFDLLQRIRASSDPVLRGLPVAALTAYAGSEDRTKALNSGFKMHLAKPIDPFDLVAAVAGLCKGHRSKRRHTSA